MQIKKTKSKIIRPIFEPITIGLKVGLSLRQLLDPSFKYKTQFNKKLAASFNEMKSNKTTDEFCEIN